jgi:hypothetical protein
LEAHVDGQNDEWRTASSFGKIEFILSQKICHLTIYTTDLLRPCVVRNYFGLPSLQLIFIDLHPKKRKEIILDITDVRAVPEFQACYHNCIITLQQRRVPKCDMLQLDDFHTKEDSL